jgi:YD repeat-containing protein
LSKSHTVSGSGAEITTYTYNSDNELTQQLDSVTGTITYTYDANGSQINNGTNIYVYDLRNKLVKIENESGTVLTSYVYDDAGDRVQETTSGTTTYYLTDANNPTGYAEPIETWTVTAGGARSSAAIAMTYLIGDHVFGQIASGTVSYYLIDGHGSTRALVSSTGSVTATYNYDAFGDAITFTPSVSSPIFLFGGDAVYDYLSGLYMNGDGTRDRSGFEFIQRDSSSGNNSDPMSLHTYLYGNADSINGFDPSGHDLLSLVLSIAGELAFNVAMFATTYAPAIESATTIAGAVWLVSGIELALEQTGFLPQNDYTPYIFAISGALFTAGQSLQALSANTVQITSPLRGSSDGKLINGIQANAECAKMGYTLAPYAPDTLAAEGTVSSEADLVRLYGAGNTSASGTWTMPRSAVVGLSPAQLQSKFSLPFTPTSYSEVNAVGDPARVGIAGTPYGGTGGGVQVQLLNPQSANFTDMGSIPPNGIPAN